MGQGKCGEGVRLAQGYGPDMPAGTNTIFFIDHNLKHDHKKDVYVRIITMERPHKNETKRVRWTVGEPASNTMAT